MNKLVSSAKVLLLAGILSLNPAFTLASETAEGVEECLKINDQLVKKKQITQRDGDDLETACSSLLSQIKEIGKREDGENEERRKKIRKQILQETHLTQKDLNKEENYHVYLDIVENIKSAERKRVINILKDNGFNEILEVLIDKGVRRYTTNGSLIN